ncbi:hypothetical protein, partial [Faecalicatena contorta]|uniref:hypothetical protein n=1 Tax=Faecalicatena contorta TaxID=39482 RepID=UPI0031D27B1C
HLLNRLTYLLKQKTYLSPDWSRGHVPSPHPIFPQHPSPHSAQAGLHPDGRNEGSGRNMQFGILTGLRMGLDTMKIPI